MSVKIFNGYKIDKYMTLSELNEFSNELRIKMKDYSLEQFHMRMAKLATTMIDYFTIFGEERLKEHVKEQYGKYRRASFYIDDISSPFFYSWDILYSLERYIEKENIGHSTYKAEVVYIPVGKKTLCLFFSGNRSLESIFENTDIIEEYFYYDNTDKPDDISNRDWNKREKDWSKALNNFVGVPSLSGLTATLINEAPSYFYLKVEKAAKYIPNKEKRVEDILPFVMKDKFQLKEFAQEFSYDDWIKTDEYKDLLKEKKKELSDRLIDDIDLSSWIKKEE